MEPVEQVMRPVGYSFPKRPERNCQGNITKHFPCRMPALSGHGGQSATGPTNTHIAIDKKAPVNNQCAHVNANGIAVVSELFGLNRPGRGGSGLLRENARGSKGKKQYKKAYQMKPGSNWDWSNCRIRRRLMCGCFHSRMPRAAHGSLLHG